MKLNLIPFLAIILLLAVTQSCTTEPYQSINDIPVNGNSNHHDNDDDGDDNDDDDDNSTSGTGTTTGGTTTGTGTGTTTGGTTGGTTTGTGTGTTTGGTTTGGTTTGAIVLGGNSSSTGLNKSHNIGQNCMNCHNPGGSGSGKGVWVVGGTAYNSSAGTATAPNVVVKFYTGPNGTGTLKYILNADAKGNFYSVGPVDFTGGLYPAVVGATATKYMGSSITTGACNSCHAGGTSTARVWTN